MATGHPCRWRWDKLGWVILQNVIEEAFNGQKAYNKMSDENISYASNHCDEIKHVPGVFEVILYKTKNETNQCSVWPLYYLNTMVF